MKKLTVVFEKTATGYSCYATEIDGLIGVGADRKELELSFFEAVQQHIAYVIEQGGFDSLDACEVEWLYAQEMTYRELLKVLTELAEEKLDQQIVAKFDFENDENLIFYF